MPRADRPDQSPSFTPSPPPLPDIAKTEPCVERARRQLAMLQELAQIGMALARALGRQGAGAVAYVDFNRESVIRQL